jgi:hypothetical protein
VPSQKGDHDAGLRGGEIARKDGLDRCAEKFFTELVLKASSASFPAFWLKSPLPVVAARFAR